MSLSRSPSPVPGGGWSSPGLNINTSGRSSPARGLSGTNGSPIIWEGSRMRTNGGSGYPSFSTQNQGFFTRHMRRLSSSLPRFNSNSRFPYAEKEKLGRGRWDMQNVPLLGRAKSIFARMGRKLKLRLLICFIISLCIFIFYHSRMLCCCSLVTMGNADFSASLGIPLAKNFMARGRPEVCNHIGCQCRRRCDGVEGCKRMGH